MDDGSTDEQSKEVLRTYEADFERRGWRIVWGENCYSGCARNKAVGHTKGKVSLSSLSLSLFSPSLLSLSLLNWLFLGLAGSVSFTD